MTLDEARDNIGNPVIYRGHLLGIPEEGVITSVNDQYVFVRYRWQHPTADGQATPPERLTLGTV